MATSKKTEKVQSTPHKPNFSENESNKSVSPILGKQANRYAMNHHIKSGKIQRYNTDKSPSDSQYKLEQIKELEEPSDTNNTARLRHNETTKKANNSERFEAKNKNNFAANQERNTKLSPNPNLKPKQKSPNLSQHTKSSMVETSVSNVDANTEPENDSLSKLTGIDDPTRLTSAAFMKLSLEEKNAVLANLEEMSKLRESSSTSETLNDDKTKTHREQLEEEIERKIARLQQLEVEEKEKNERTNEDEINEHKKMIAYLTKEIETQAHKVAETTRKFLEKIDENKPKRHSLTLSESNSMKEISEYDSNSELDEEQNNEFTKVIRKRFWWEKNQSNLRVPMYQMPKNRLSKVKPRTDSGFIEEEIIVPLNQLITSRNKNCMTLISSMNKFSNEFGKK